MRACQSHDVYIRAIPRAEWAYLFGPFSPRILTREAPSQACELFQIRPTESWDVQSKPLPTFIVRMRIRVKHTNLL